MNQQFAVVTGAFGYSGSYIAKLLQDRGIRVRTLTAHRPTVAGDDGIEIAPFNFDQPDQLARSLDGASAVFNTYWVRFAYRGVTYERAATNIRALIDAARRANVPRFVHISITNASPDSPFPYFRGKGIVEQALRTSGLSHAILRPAHLFGGPKEILTNNIAWLLRKFPLFAVPGDGQYRIQPIFVEDLAAMAVEAAGQTANSEIDAVGPEIFAFDEFVRVIARTIGSHCRIVRVNPQVALALASVIGRVMGDVLLTRDEIGGLMANMLVSDRPPTAPTHFSEWLARHAREVGLHYSSELTKRA
ncbi:MAG TPA: NAD(P)H-binding protein [Candidatus Binataceae bacterium]|nr:NAD(P)H-binding protein [Candidatus Binataceae bacterium]